ncbi:hypothetical protein GCM10010458_22070 [Microbacterium luteolum]
MRIVRRTEKVSSSITEPVFSVMFTMMRPFFAERPDRHSPAITELHIISDAATPELHLLQLPYMPALPCATRFTASSLRHTLDP